jgi:hypothetical protein
MSIDWSKPIEAVDAAGAVTAAKWHWRDESGDELGVRFVTCDWFGWPFRDGGQPVHKMDRVWTLRNVTPPMTDLSPETVERHGRLAMRVRELADDPDMQIEPAERARILHIAMDVLEDYIVTARASLSAEQRRDPCGICGVVECDGSCPTPPDDPRADEGLVEAVAKALYGKLVAPLAQDWEQEGAIVRDFCLTLARAALAAARSHGGM